MVVPPAPMKARWALAASAGSRAGFAAKDDGHVEEQLTQSARDDECIATVVAGPRQHQHGSLARTGHADGDVGGCEPRALHQRLPAGCGFHAAQLLGPEYRQKAHGDHYRTMVRARRLASSGRYRPPRSPRV